MPIDLRSEMDGDTLASVEYIRYLRSMKHRAKERLDYEYQNLLNCTQWQKLRRAILAVHPICEKCGEMPAKEVHHIIPVGDGVSLREKIKLAYDPNNLQALCHYCHVAIHRERGSLKEIVQRRASASLAEFHRLFFE